MESGDYIIRGTNRLGREFGYTFYCSTSRDLKLLLLKEEWAGSTNVTHEPKIKTDPAAGTLPTNEAATKVPKVLEFTAREEEAVKETMRAYREQLARLKAQREKRNRAKAEKGKKAATNAHL